MACAAVVSGRASAFASRGAAGSRKVTASIAWRMPAAASVISSEWAATLTGSTIARDGHVIGSALVAQPFADGRYFQPRPSAANYDPMAAAGSNMARSNPDLRTRIAELTLAVAEREGFAPAQVPAELVTHSGGGLDPPLSPRAVQVQVARVAKARGIDIPTVERVLARHIEAPQFGVLGQARVNVLQLNLALDALSR